MQMEKDTYQAAFLQAITELTEAMDRRETLDAEREAMDRRIANFREAVLSLGALCGRSRGKTAAKYPGLFPDLIDPDTGLTDAVRKVLQKFPKASLSPVQVRHQLGFMNYDLSSYTNVLASLHTILKRLKEKGQVSAGTRDGKTVYKWRAFQSGKGSEEAETTKVIKN